MGVIQDWVDVRVLAAGFHLLQLCACKAQCQLGHFHRVTFAAALPTVQLSDIQGRCGGGMPGGGLIACLLFYFSAWSMLMCVVLVFLETNELMVAFMPLIPFWKPPAKRHACVRYLVFFLPKPACCQSDFCYLCVMSWHLDKYESSGNAAYWHQGAM